VGLNMAKLIYLDPGSYDDDVQWSLK